jgi:hypothetical protein
MSVGVAMRVAVSVPMVVAMSLGLGDRYHQVMLYYNIIVLKAESRRPVRA